MKIKICSRSILEKMSGSGFEPRTAVISIYRCRGKRNRLLQGAGVFIEALF